MRMLMIIMVQGNQVRKGARQKNEPCVGGDWIFGGVLESSGTLHCGGGHFKIDDDDDDDDRGWLLK